MRLSKKGAKKNKTLRRWKILREPCKGSPPTPPSSENCGRYIWQPSADFLCNWPIKIKVSVSRWRVASDFGYCLNSLHVPHWRNIPGARKTNPCSTKENGDWILAITRPCFQTYTCKNFLLTFGVNIKSYHFSNTWLFLKQIRIVSGILAISR